MGKEYVVFGICLWKTAVFYLVLPRSTGGPNWYPAELFEITNHQLPSNWTYSFWGIDEANEVKAVWGYKELALDDDHFDELSEKESRALEIFEKRRGEIESAS
jgi:hypothetical protein